LDDRKSIFPVKTCAIYPVLKLLEVENSEWN